MKGGVVTKADLSKWSFVLSHEIVIDRQLPRFKQIQAVGTRASVYLWLSPLDDTAFDVLYCGKAGYGIARRLMQHQGGFKYNGTGKTNLDLLEDKLNSGAKIYVYAREAGSIELFGVKVSMYSAEEEAMCELLMPLWNRAKFPDGKAQSNADTAGVDLTVQDVFDDLPGAIEVKAHLQSLEKDRRQTFIAVMKILEKHLLGNGIEQKVVGGYTGQPRGYSQKPMLVYCRRSPSGRAVRGGWYARVPLVDEPNAPMTLLLNPSMVLPGADEALFTRVGAYCIPKSLSAFVAHPDRHLATISHSRVASR